MNIRPKPLFIPTPWFKAFPGSDIKMHYCWTFRRNPALRVIPEDHPQVKLLPDFQYNRGHKRKDPKTGRMVPCESFSYKVKKDKFYIASIDERIAEHERWCDAQTVRLFKAEFARRGLDRNVKAMLAIDDEIKELRHGIEEENKKKNCSIGKIERLEKRIDRLSEKRKRLWLADFGRYYEVRVTDRTVTRMGGGMSVTNRCETDTRRVWLFDHDIQAFGFTRAAMRELGIEGCDD